MSILFKQTVLVATSSLIFVGCVKTTNVAYSDKNISVSFKDTVNLVNVHASHGYYEMTVCGEKYSEVRGYNPFYLSIPEKDSILFVTGRNYDNGQATVHIVNLKTKTEIHFPACDSHIGSNIRTNSPDMSEVVEKIDGDKIIIHAEGLHSSFRYYIDLSKPKFEKEEAEFRNSPFGTTNHYVYIEGKSPFK